ncbi:glutathione S-transferase family protein [Altererythrobacter salegens]|uniref:Glutathione S-transferase family protein n=1 Tax=Croceibacterium salegens TaxID=1737568 RepID=A0A6I4SYL5_9SPHN|nr:glutathione S-transferase family protein [Croceibacterium salegens]MXO61214.1 glutathione S-transferase family protein [Croceibacterium salegens]
MALKYYHAEPMANSLKSMIPLKEKGLAYESVYVDLHKFEQHSDWFTAINPEGQVPVLDHDGTIITHTTVINEYLEDVFPDDQPASGPLRPKDPVGAARMRYWNKFVDEQVMNYVSMHGWHRLIRQITKSIEEDRFEELMSHVPLPDQQKKWRTARSGFEQKDLDHALDKIEYALNKVEAQLGQTAYLAGDSYGLADINFYAHCGLSVNRMFPKFDVDANYPNIVRWREAISDRPAVQKALAAEDRTQPGLRTWSGDGREHS